MDSQSKGMPGQYGKKGKKADIIAVNTKEPPCDEIFLDDVHAPHTNELNNTLAHYHLCCKNKHLTSVDQNMN